ncbi:hypothetical protein J4G66_20145 [Aeromonas dhakensis]|uniref:hypothetical protein n=2 Tax=Aeromonas dhakensis TaxID=196024 RepID=UPI001A9003DC|nr:hypothetical protein [Aeromonas dhakensis]MBS4718257.1 hypothetical protein [Aeromonas dhakensis]QSR45245.1 hypothetical protein HUI95_20465 [Aeromonas dhakensis]WAF68224.1 hypothetical protein NRK98_20420 [Aeromonas dhakensis]HDZ8879397.1 hypothetical protein [Aeromonas dhakensis]
MMTIKSSTMPETGLNIETLFLVPRAKLIFIFLNMILSGAGVTLSEIWCCASGDMIWQLVVPYIFLLEARINQSGAKVVAERSSTFTVKSLLPYPHPRPFSRKGRREQIRCPITLR